MSDQTRMYWIHALTPLHVGAGRGVGYIDLPIMREKVTKLPLVPGSAIKGVLADHYGASDKESRYADEIKRKAFGISDPDKRDSSESGANSGSLVFTDARLVCLPVRSLYGTFAWCTSPLVLTRLLRDLEAAKLSNQLTAPGWIEPQHVHVAKDANSVLRGNDSKVYLEDLDLSFRECPVAAAWAEFLGTWLFGTSDKEKPWREAFRQRFAVVPDDIFNFLCETGTEVVARVKIDDEKKTVVGGALWYEESLPAETILAGLVWCDRVFGQKSNGNGAITEANLLDTFCSKELPLQIGGKATVGKGRVRCAFTKTEGGQ